jgi:diacylglycerol kinase (ATP)
MSSLASVTSFRPSGQDAPRRRFLIVHNPTAGARRTRRLCRLIGVLDQRFGAEVTVVRTGGRGDAESIARSVAPGAFDAVVAAGGDGTINEVINGLAGSGCGLPLGLVPLGTANVLANELGLTTEVESLADVLVRGAEKPVNLGSINGRRFAMMAGAGFDAQVVDNLDSGLKKWSGKGAYAVGALARLWRGGGAGYRVSIGECSWNAASVIVANGRFYGGRFVCAPDASLFDPSLHVCLFPRRGRWNALRYIWGVTAGRIGHFADYRILRTDHLTLSGPPGEPVQADGDIVARLPVTIRLEKDRLPMLVGLD